MQHQTIKYVDIDINTCIDTIVVRPWHNPYQLTLYVNVCEWDISCLSRWSIATRQQPYACNHITLTILVYFGVFVATLSFGSRPRQRGYKGASQEKAWESHHILLGVYKSVREWTLTLLRQLPLWEMESRWTSKTS